MGPLPSVSAWLFGCLLLFLLPCCAPALLVAFQAPVLYTLAALIPTAVLLGCTAGQPAVPAAATPTSTDSDKANADSMAAQLGLGGMAGGHKHKLRQKQLRSAPGAARQQLAPTGAAPASRPQADCAAAAAASQDEFTSMAILGSSSASGPPCGVSCSSSNCPWHLPLAPSLRYWGQDSSRTSASRRSSGSTGKRPSSTDDQLSSHALAAHAAADLQAFSFDSTACPSTGAAPAALGLLRSFSAPAAPPGSVESAGLSGALAAPEVAAAAALLAAASKLSMADACAAAATQPLRVSLQLQDTKPLQAQHVASALPDSPGPFWVSRRAAGAAAVQQDDASQERLTAPASVAVSCGLHEHASPAAVASVRHDVCTAPGLSHLQQQQVQDTASQHTQAQAQGQTQVRVQADVCVQNTAVQQQAQAEQQADMPVRLQAEALRQVQHMAGQQPMQAQGRAGSQIPVLQHAAGLQAHQQHVVAQALQHDDADEPRTPRAQLQPELVAVLDQILQDSRHLHGTDQQCYVEHQHQQRRPTDPQLHQQQAALNSPVTPLPFIATTSRHSMCMLQPSFRLHAAGSPLSASLSSGGFAAWAPPLPSPAESPLARRLSERDDTGLPTSSPALQELLSSGASRRQLRRGCSLDSRRSVSSPGSHTCVASHPMQQQQQPQQEAEQWEAEQLEAGLLEAPWASMRHSLRSVTHLLQQRQQHLQQQQQQRDVQQVEGGPWYRRFQLERRHTFCTAVELAVTADGAAAAVDTAAVAAAAAAAVAAVDVAAVAEAVAAAVAAVDAGASTDAVAAVAGDAGVCSSSSPPRSQLLRSSDGGSNSSGVDGVVSPNFAAVGRLTSHRLSFCSGLSDLESESDAAEGDASDATAAVLCSSGAGGDSAECKPHQDLAPLSSDSKFCSSSSS